MERRRAPWRASPLGGLGKHMTIAFRGVLRWGLAACGALAAAVGAYAATLVSTGNFHELVPSEAFRSAQPSQELILRLRREHGLATILNLRGASVGRPWYDDEAKAARAAGVQLISFRMSAATELTPDEVRRLIAIMRDAPKPILIHCRSGADRTGIASALYLAALKGADEERAEWQLSPLYGHVAFYGLPSFAMDRTWEATEPSLGFFGS